MNVVTWNVNSVRARLERVQNHLRTTAPDVLCIQESKVEDHAFPRDAFVAEGYAIETYGQKTYNGVAIAARNGIAIEDVVRGFPDDGPESNRRVIAATAGGLRIVNVYVVNGQEVGSPKYVFKLEWLAKLRAFLAAEMVRHPALVVCGDFNIAPDDRDVHDPELWRGRILCSEPEREALRSLLALGLEDLFRRFTQEGGLFTWWDYRALAFPKNHGLRLDLFLATPAAAARCTSVAIDRNERKGQGASDHVPVAATFGA